MRMNKTLRAGLLATTLACSFVALDAMSAPAVAQAVEVDFDGFHDALSPYGAWLYSDRWGEVWAPDVDSDFRPYYSEGYWAYTDDYGWLWVSDYPWGDVTFHYGRWVNDPDDGWLWVPGYVWSPGWVIWRSNDRYTGWMPMPPDDGFLDGDDGGAFSITFSFGHADDYYGYRRWYGQRYDDDRFAMNWTFIDTRDLGGHDYRSHAVPRTQVVNVIHNTVNITNYTIVNNYVVNRSVTPQAVVRAGGRPVQPVRIGAVLRHPDLVTTAAAGRTVQVHMREVRPHGNGIANSAPAPGAAVLNSLSGRLPHRGGNAPAHLYTRETVIHAPLKPAKESPPIMHDRGPADVTPPPAVKPRQERETPSPTGIIAPPAAEPHRGSDRPAEMHHPDGAMPDMPVVAPDRVHPSPAPKMGAPTAPPPDRPAAVPDRPRAHDVAPSAPNPMTPEARPAEHAAPPPAHADHAPAPDDKPHPRKKDDDKRHPE